MSIFGFSTEPSKGGDFTPIIKYDARAGRCFRIDRMQDSAGNYSNEVVDITGLEPGSPRFKAIADFENVQVGWLDFPPGQAPSMVLVPMGSQLPPRPSERHKNGLRFMLKLSKECGGDKPIREVAGTSKAFLSGIEAVYLQYLAERDKQPGKLPVIMLEKTTPVTTGSGAKSSTNYHPTFKLVGWVPRGDLPVPAQSQYQQPFQVAAGQQPIGNGHTTNGAAPSTGSRPAVAPQQQAKPLDQVSADDFG